MRTLAEKIFIRFGVECDTTTADLLAATERELNAWDTALCNGDVRVCEETDRAFTRENRPTRNVEADISIRIYGLACQLGLRILMQRDPRGCSLYIGGDNLTDCNYPTEGIACSS